MANTPFLDLVKPAGTDRALVSVINSNSDKIDTGVSTLSEQIVMNAFGTKATIAALESALATFGDSMPNNSVRNIVFALDPAQGVFKNANYVGTISRTSSGRYTVLAQSHSSVQSGDLVVGVYANSAWSWDNVALNSQIGGLTVKYGTFTHSVTATAKGNTYGDTNDVNIDIGVPSGKTIKAISIYPNSDHTVWVGRTSVSGNKINRLYIYSASALSAVTVTFSYVCWYL